MLLIRKMFPLVALVDIVATRRGTKNQRSAVAQNTTIVLLADKHQRCVVAQHTTIALLASNQTLVRFDSRHHFNQIDATSTRTRRHPNTHEDSCELEWM